MPEANILETEMRQIAETPSLARLRHKLVAVFESGCLPKRKTCGSLRAILARPLESFAIVSRARSGWSRAKNLNLMERAIWRVLVPSPKTDWQGQDLAAYQCYFLEQRRNTPNSCRERCDATRKNWWGCCALRHRGRRGFLGTRAGRCGCCNWGWIRTGGSKRKNGEAGARELQKQLSELRRRLVRRLNADSASLGPAESRQSLVKIENDLARRLDERAKRTCAVERRDYFDDGIQEATRHGWKKFEESQNGGRLTGPVRDPTAAARTQACCKKWTGRCESAYWRRETTSVSTWMLQGVSRAASSPRMRQAAGNRNGAGRLAIREPWQLRLSGSCESDRR